MPHTEGKKDKSSYPRLPVPGHEGHEIHNLHTDVVIGI